MKHLIKALILILSIVTFKSLSKKAKVQSVKKSIEASGLPGSSNEMPSRAPYGTYKLESWTAPPSRYGFNEYIFTDRFEKEIKINDSGGRMTHDGRWKLYLTQPIVKKKNPTHITFKINTQHLDPRCEVAIIDVELS